MALPATDNFNRTNGALGANWTDGPGGGLSIVSNEVTGTTGGVSDGYWSADAPNASQYAQCKIAAVLDSSGPAVRVSATDWVSFVASTSNWTLYWYNDSDYTTIGDSWETEPAVGDIARIEAEGTAFRGYVNGTLRCSGTNASAPATGYGGLIIDLTSARVDDFEVGNLVSYIPRHGFILHNDPGMV